MDNLAKIKAMGPKIQSILSTDNFPVGVTFVSAESDFPGVERLEKHRYCQALMKARRGQAVLLERDEVSCPAAARAFGFRPLPPALESGKGLQGFGIVADAVTGRNMFRYMPVLPPGSVKKMLLSPLNEVREKPDVVVLEDAIEKLMWVVLAYLQVIGGQRVESSTAVLQAACVDATIVPYLEKRLNLSYGCYGCRDATDIANGEGVLGFPVESLPEIVKYLEFLNRKAIPNSRSKKAYAALTCKDENKRKMSGEAADKDPFSSNNSSS